VADFLATVGNTIVDRSSDELIGAVVIALGTALAMVGLYLVGRRKVSDNLTPLIALMIVGNLISMALAAGYVVRARRNGRFPSRGVAPARYPWHPSSPAPDLVLLDTIFRAADKNHDGLISAEEASQSAAEVVRNSDSSGRGSVDSASLRALLQATLAQGQDRIRRHGTGLGPEPPPRFGPPPRGPFGPRLPESIDPPAAAEMQESARAAGTSPAPNDRLWERKGKLD
jgi:hypothetical protein